MNKRLIACVVGMLFSFLIQSFQKSWEEELRDHYSVISSEDSNLSPIEKLLSMALRLQKIDLEDFILKSKDMKKMVIDKSNLLKQNLTDDEKAKYLVLKKYFEHRCKKLNIAGEVTLVFVDTLSMAYAANFRLVYLKKSFLKDLSIDTLLFSLAHELTHVQQHARDGLLEFASNLRTDDKIKRYEIEADQNALSLICLSCRKYVEKDMFDLYEQGIRPDSKYLSKEEFLAEIRKPFEDHGGMFNCNTSCLSCKFQYYTK